MPAAAPDPASAITEKFPHWLSWVTGTGRWRASRTDTLSAADPAAFLRADDPGALAAQIRAQETAPAPCDPDRRRQRPAREFYEQHLFGPDCAALLAAQIPANAA